MIKIYTDGSYKDGFIGYSYLIYDNSAMVVKNIIVRKAMTTLRNVEAEILAVLAALAKLKSLYLTLQDERVIIASDLIDVRNILGSALKEKSDKESCFMHEESGNVSNKSAEEVVLERYKNEFRQSVEELKCTISFEYVRGHGSNMHHNSVDSALLKMINIRISAETQVKKSNEKNKEKKVEAYLPDHLYSQYEFQFIREVHRRLSEMSVSQTAESIRLLMENDGFVYEPSKSKMKRKVHELLEDAVRYKILIKEDGKYKAAEVDEIFYMHVDVKREENEQKKVSEQINSKKISQYENDYKNFLVNLLRKEKRPLSLSEIMLLTIERKNPWIKEKGSRKQSLRELLNDIAQEGRIIVKDNLYTIPNLEQVNQD